MSEPRSQLYAGALEALQVVLDNESEADEVLRRAVALLGERIPHYTWLGLYFVEGDELVLGPWAGAEPVEHPRLPLSGGAIGRAVAAKRTEIVDDLRAVEGAEACFAWTRSEIDVPVIWEGTTVAVIGIDSDRPAAFGAEDADFLERVATLISAHCLVGWDTGGVPWPDVP